MSVATDILGWGMRRAPSRRSGKVRAWLFGVVGGSMKTTSAVASIDGDIVTTHSGTRYRLVGEPAHNFTGYLSWPIDPAMPLATLVPEFTFEFAGVSK